MPMISLTKKKRFGMRLKGGLCCAGVVFRTAILDSYTKTLLWAFFVEEGNPIESGVTVGITWTRVTLVPQISNAAYQNSVGSDPKTTNRITRNKQTKGTKRNTT